MHQSLFDRLTEFILRPCFGLTNGFVRPRGIKNLGNTCYLNTVLQVFSNVRSIIQYLQNGGFQGLLLQRLREACAELHQGGIFCFVSRSFRPQELLRCLVLKEKRYSGLDQQDAHELYQCLVHHISISLRSPGLKFFIGSDCTERFPSTGWMKSDLVCNSCGWRRPMQEHTTFQDITLSCSNEHVTTSRSLCVYLAAMFSSEQVEHVECLSCTLRDLIERQERELKDICSVLEEMPLSPPVLRAKHDAITRRESLLQLADYAKSGCCSPSFEDLSATGFVKPIRTNYTKKSGISKWPQTLCIHIARLYYNSKEQSMMKNRSHVDYPFVLSKEDLAKCTGASSVCPFKYYLKAVLVHHGGANSGHYSVFIKLESKDCTGLLHEVWFHVSDENIRACTVSDVLKAEAYMLFYEGFRPED